MTYKNYLQDAEDDYMMTVTTICGPATVFTFNRVISNTDPDTDYPLSSPQPYSPQSHIQRLISTPIRRLNKWPSTTSTTGLGTILLT